MSGREPDHTDMEVLEALADVDEPVASTRDIADALDYTLAATRVRLQALEHRGMVGSKLIGQSRAWWLTDLGRECLD